jgi:hypothetical protein
MRWYFKVAILAAIALIGVGLGTAQQPPFGGFGGFTKGPTNPATLAQMESVKKELRLSDEQVAKIPSAIMKALAEVLDADQLKRLKQIDLQVKGAKAFVEPAVQDGLKITSEQKDIIQTILADADRETEAVNKEMQKEFKTGNFKSLQSMRDKMTAIARESKERCNSVLTADQRRMWQEMIGDEFKIEKVGN